MRDNFWLFVLKLTDRLLLKHWLRSNPILILNLFRTAATCTQRRWMFSIRPSCCLTSYRLLIRRFRKMRALSDRRVPSLSWQLILDWMSTRSDLWVLLGRVHRSLVKVGLVIWILQSELSDWMLWLIPEQIWHLVGLSFQTLPAW